MTSFRAVLLILIAHRLPVTRSFFLPERRNHQIKKNEGGERKKRRREKELEHKQR